MRLHDHIKYKDCKIQTNIIILDFSKAFDIAHHDKLLLYKLGCFGIAGEILGWILAFLKQRKYKGVYYQMCQICITCVEHMS